MSGHRKLLVLLTGVFILDHMDRHILSITLEQIGQEFALNDLQLGALSGLAFAVFFCLFGFPLARLARPGRRKALAAITVAVWSGLTALTALAGSYTHLLLARMGVAVSEAGFTPAAHSMIADAVPENRRAGAFAFFSAGANVGLFLAFLIGGFVAATYGWRAAFLVAGLPGLAFAIVISLGLREPPTVAAKTEELSFASVWRDMIRHTSTRFVLLGAALTAIVNYGAITWLATFLIRRHELGVEQAGLYLAVVVGLLGGAATFAGGVAADRLATRHPAWRIGLVALIIVIAKLLAVAAYLQPAAVGTLALLVFPAMTGGIYLGPTFAHIYSRIHHAARPRATAIILFLLNLIGLGLGPILVGAISTALTDSAGADRALMIALVMLQVIGIFGAVAFFAASRCRDLRLETRT